MPKNESFFITKLNRREFIVKLGQAVVVVGGMSLLPSSIRLAMANSSFQCSSDIGFNGEWLDPAIDGYHLGNGYRVYQPKVMRFNKPDNLSPFAEGGINTYLYCHNDPINFSDPSGHLNIGKIFWGIVGIIAGVAGIIFAVPTGGSSLLLAAGVIGGVSGIVGGSLQIASGVIDDGDVSRKLNIATIPFDIIGLLSGSYSSYKSVKNLCWIRSGGAFEDIAQPGLGSRLWSRIRHSGPSDKYSLEWAIKVNPAKRLGCSEGGVIATRMSTGTNRMTYEPRKIHGGFTKVQGQKVGVKGYTIYQGIMTAQSIGSLAWTTVHTIPGRLGDEERSGEKTVSEGRSANPAAIKTQLYTLEELRQRINYGVEVQQVIRQLPLS